MRKAPLSIQELPKQPTTRKENPTTLKNPSPQSQNLWEAPTLYQVHLAFPKPGGRARITVVDGAYQIQHLPSTFNGDY